MKYYVMEFQTSNGVPTQITTTKNTLNEALAKYHEVLMYAANSNIDIHGCLVLDQNGFTVERDLFTHISEPEEE